MISALINYRVSDARMAIFNVTNVTNYVENNGMGVLKTAQHAYDDLKKNGDAINSPPQPRLPGDLCGKAHVFHHQTTP